MKKVLVLLCIILLIGTLVACNSEPLHKVSYLIY